MLCTGSYIASAIASPLSSIPAAITLLQSARVAPYPIFAIMVKP
jgi:hypothetical protein